MHLVVGIGNPGARYARNRHNIGFMAIDAIARRHGIGTFRSRFKGELAEGAIAGERRLLLKPQTFMNASGEAVLAAMSFYKIAPEDIVVIHDEIDLREAKLRVKRGGGNAGEEDNGARREQEAEEPQQDFHYERPARVGPAPNRFTPHHAADTGCPAVGLNRPTIAPLSIVCRRSVFCSN